MDKSPTQLLKNEFVAFVNKKQEFKIDHVLPEMYLNASWKDIINLGRSRLLRSTAILHELRHLLMEMLLHNKVSHPLHGQVHIRGKIPGDKSSDNDFYQDFLSFSEIKTFHSQLKIELIKFRQVLRTNPTPEAMAPRWVELQLIRESLFVLSHRILLMTRILRDFNDPRITYETSYLNGIVTVFANFRDDQGNSFIAAIPLVRAKSDKDPQLKEIYKRQVLWLSFTARQAAQQAFNFHSNLIQKVSGKHPADQLAVWLAEGQQIISTLSLIPPEPILEPRQ